MEGLPEWLDVAKIVGIGVLVLAIVQYIKASIPDKLIKWVAILVGILVSIASGYYMGKPLAGTGWIKAVVDGVLAAVLADTGYQFLSKKGGSGTLPSKPPTTS